MRTSEQVELAVSLMRRATWCVPDMAAEIANSTVIDEEHKFHRLMACLDALRTIVDEHGPDEDWYRDYFTLTGDHMVLTDEGWVPAEMNTREYTGYDPAEVLDEINAPRK